MDQELGNTIVIGSIEVSSLTSSPIAGSFGLVLVESLSRANNIPESNRDIEPSRPAVEHFSPLRHSSAMQLPSTVTFCLLTYVPEKMVAQVNSL